MTRQESRPPAAAISLTSGTALGVFDHRPDRKRCYRQAFCSRHEYRAHSALSGSGWIGLAEAPAHKIGLAPSAVEGVDPPPTPSRWPIRSATRRRPGRAPSLGIGGNGVFEIEDQRIAGKVRALFSARALDPGINKTLRRGRITS